MTDNGQRRILVLSGKRGGFGAMKPMLRLMVEANDIELQLVLTDQHANPRFGATASEVLREFPVASIVDIGQEDDRPLSRSRALGRCLEKMSGVVDDLKPDICILYGDRGETLATAVAATMLNVPIAHIQGGDVSGSLDESMRHAITKLAHLHFPSNDASAERIRRLGEEAWRIHVVGDCHIDCAVAGEFAPPDVVAARLSLDLSKPIIIVLQHSETTAPEAAYDQMVETLAAVRESGHHAVVVHPCSDQGYEGVLKAIREMALPPQFQVHVNLEAPLFWGLLNVASVLVGNSSAGLIETPSFRKPALNIGRRQAGRLHAENVIHVPHDRRAISKAIHRAIGDPHFAAIVKNCTQPYGDGLAAQRIVDVLRHIELNGRLRVKPPAYANELGHNG